MCSRLRESVSKGGRKGSCSKLRFLEENSLRLCKAVNEKSPRCQ